MKPTLPRDVYDIVLKASAFVEFELWKTDEKTLERAKKHIKILADKVLDKYDEEPRNEKDKN
jgi:hypothetical protein